AIGGGAGAFCAGGGISNQFSGTLTVSGCSFTGNLATAGLSIGSQGGAIANESNTPVSVSSSAFTGNATDGFGGAISSFGGSHMTTLSVSNSAFTSNSAPDSSGGAIFMEFGLETITHSTFTNNQAVL